MISLECVALLEMVSQTRFLLGFGYLVSYTSCMINHSNHLSTQGIVVGIMLICKEQLLVLVP